MSVAARIAIIQSIILGWSSTLIVAPEPVYWLKGNVTLVSALYGTGYFLVDLTGDVELVSSLYGTGYLATKLDGFTKLIESSSNDL